MAFGAVHCNFFKCQTSYFGCPLQNRKIALPEAGSSPVDYPCCQGIHFAVGCQLRICGVCECVFVCVCVRVCVCMCVRVCVRVCVYVCVHVRPCAQVSIGGLDMSGTIDT